MKKAVKRLVLTTLILFTALGITGGKASKVNAETVTGQEWTTPEKVRVNQTDARSAIIPFNDVESAKQNPTLRSGKSSPNYIDLNGTWKFNWVSKPAEKPDITDVTSIPENYFDITVPSSWQTNMQYAGWKGDEIDWPIYNNQEYPWQASSKSIPGQPMGNGSAAPTAYNPVGTYMRTVTIDEKDMGNRFIITFNGVEAGFYLYVNGQAVGYDEDSFTTAEFDITDYLHAGENLIAAQVYHYTTGSYIENQDMIYYAGIHRDVYITKQPKVSIFDYNVETTFDNHNYEKANLELKVDVANITDAAAARKVRVYLYDDKGTVVSAVDGLEQNVNPTAGGEGTAVFTAQVSNPKLWSAEIPNLYTLVIALCDNDGNIIQTVGKRIGFREFYVEGDSKNSEMRINGQNIEFYGVCRGEADPAGGHHVPYETIVKDVQNAKQLNINAIRTSHFPPDPNLIELADEYGLYIMDEVNVESHNARTMGIPADAQYESESGRVFPGNDRRYQNAMVDRMTSMVMRDKNNASVIIYSLGNEAGTDVSDKLAPDPQEGNFNRMIDVIKALDSEKLIHYQGWVGNQRVDIEGTMYPAHNKLNPGDKPFIMMEYQHSMGNTGGDFEKYTDVFEASPRFQGGFIWDYVDQSAYTPKDGKGGSGLTRDDLFFGFDHSWKQNSDDYNFCVNGFIFPDRTWSPQAYEIKYYYQDLKFTQTAAQAAENKFTMKNFNRFQNANFYELTWSVLENGKVLETGIFTDEEADLLPRQGSIGAPSVRELTVPFTVTEPKAGAEYILQIDYKLKEDLVYAPKGYVQGSEQFVMDIKTEEKMVELDTLPELTTVNGDKEVTVTGTADGKAFTVAFDKETGLMSTYQVDGKNLISKAPVGSFFRPEPDQNAAVGGTGWKDGGEAYDKWYGQGENMKDVTVHVTSVIPEATTISVKARLQNDSEYATEYTVYGNGFVMVNAKLTPSESAPSQLGEFGMWMQVPGEYENMTWYGRGPSETYWNRKAGNMAGVWSGSVTDQFVPYVRIQENGNKTDVRWLALQNEEGEGLLASMVYGSGYTGDMLEAVALHYTPGELSTHQSGNWYPYQAEATEDVNLRLLLHQKGVGNVTWATEPVSAVINKSNSKLLEYSYMLMPLSKDDDPMEKSKVVMGELPELPAITSIKVDGKVLSDFDPNQMEYTVVLPSGYTGIPDVTATGPSTLDISCAQAEALPGTAVVTVAYTSPDTGMVTKTEYKVIFDPGTREIERPLSNLVTVPSIQAETPMIHPGGRLLFAYSGYNGIYQNTSEKGALLTTGPSGGEKTYETGFAGNAEQILDIDISSLDAMTFSGVGGIDWALKANNSKSTIIFEVWAHKDVSALTEEYYKNPDNINNDKNGNGTADWTASGWTKVASSALITGNAKEPKHIFDKIPMTYEDGDAVKSYEAIRLVMNANGNNGHDQGVWGDPRIQCITEEWPGSGFEEPKEDTVEIKVNGVALENFDPAVKEYNVKLSYGMELPVVTAFVRDQGGVVPVKISEITQVPGDVTLSYDNGVPTEYTIHFTKDAAIEGETAYLSDVVEIPKLNGPASVRNGNLLYAYSGAGAIYTDRSEGNGTDTALKLQNGDTAETYEHGFAGKAQQVIDIDISSQRAGTFRAKAGIDAAMKPAGSTQGSEGPTVQFEVWGHKNITRLDYSNTNLTADGTDQEDFETEGWVKLAVSPVMSNGDYNGTLEVQSGTCTFNVDLTYLDGRNAKSYEALRLVMNPVNGSNADDQGVWADARVDFVKEETPIMSMPVLDDAKIVADENGVSLPILISGIDTGTDRMFDIMFAAYDADGRMVGFTKEHFNAKDTGANIDETIRVNYDVAAASDAKLAFMVWMDEDAVSPVYGVFTGTKEGGFAAANLPYINTIAENPQASLSIDPEKNTVTVQGSGFTPNSTLTLYAVYENEDIASVRAAAGRGPDYVAQTTCDSAGKFSYTYLSNYDLEETSIVEATVGGQGLQSVVKAVNETAAEQPKLSVTNLAGEATVTTSVMDLSAVEGLFILDENAGTPIYSIVPGGTGTASLGEDGKTLTATKSGTIRIGMMTSPTATHASGARIIATLTVEIPKADKTALLEAIASAEGKEEAIYTPESWEALQEALLNAKQAAAKEEPSQEEVNAATALLEAALDGLEEEKIKSYYYLTAKVDEANKIYGTNTPKAEEYGLIYLDAANSSSAWGGIHVNEYDGGEKTMGADAPISMNVDGARKVFPQGLSGNANATMVFHLNNIPADRFEGYVGIDYTKSTKPGRDGARFYFYKDSVSEENLLADSGVINQPDDAKFMKVDLTGVQKLVIYVDNNGTQNDDCIDIADAKIFVKVDKTALNEAIALAESKKEKDYTPESWEVFEAALAAAKEIAAKENALLDEVEEAKASLQQAMDGLAEKTPERVKTYYYLTAKVDEPGKIFGTDMPESDEYGLIYMDTAVSSSGWGGFHVNEYNGGEKTMGADAPISMNVDGARKVFEQGISGNTDATLVFDLSSIPAERFEGYVGVDYIKAGKNKDGVRFYFYKDSVSEENLLADSGIIKQPDNAKLMMVDLTGVQKLVIYVDKVSSNSDDCIDIADAKIYLNTLDLMQDILNKANEAQILAEDAQTAAEDAAEAADKAKGEAITAQTNAATAARDAAGAKDEAERARNDALDAQSKAESARGEADKAKIAADMAQQKAEDAQAAAEAAQKLAAANQSEAKNAQKAAEEAQAAAELALENAAKAESNAKIAETNAQTAAGNAKTAEQNAKAAELNALTAKEAAEDAVRNAQTSETNASVSASAAQTAKEAAEAARNAAEGYNDDAQAAAAAAAEALADAKTAKQQANAAKEEAVSAKDAAEKARDDAETARQEALEAKNNAALSATAAANAKDIALAAQAKADAASKLAETYKDGAEAAQNLAKAYRDGALEAQRLAIEAQKKAEQAAKEAEEIWKKVQQETAEKLAQADRNLQKSKNLVAKQKFRARKAAILSIKSTKKKQAKLNWKIVKDAEGYVIQYIAEKKFSSPKTVEVEVKGGTTQTKAIKKLKSGKTYYFRVRAYRTINGKRIYSKYSAKKSLKIK
ncbi:MAG: DUF4981 domain-containing protein [Eubacterium sp.]|nr:DUF4981 domain-containing protein [Eubacterium sp.]